MTIGELNPYPRYRDSGVEWLGAIPNHWTTSRLRASVATIATGLWGAEPNGDDDIACVRVADFERSQRMVKRRPLTQRAVPSPLRAGRLLQPGDLLLEKSGGGEQQPVGTVVLYDLPGKAICSNFISKVTCGPGYKPKYINHLHRVLYAIGLNRRSIKQTTGIQNLDSKSYLREQVAFPPPEEQDGIVRFVDWANGRLERAIRAKRKVVALLNEEKQAIIHRAVTRGLDPAVPFKPSSIPWLGDIPQHWETKRIKFLLREVDLRSTTGNEPLLSMRMHHGLVLFSEHFNRPPQAATLVGFKVVKPGQFVVNRMQAGNGVIFASTLYGLVSPDYAVFDPIGDVDINFLGELFRSRTIRAKFRAESKGLGTGTSGFLRLYNDRFGAIHIALPDTREQKRIVAGLGLELRLLDLSLDRLEREIELIREYQTRLISDVVTGKLDVREAAARLPVEAESEPVAADEAELEPEETEEEAIL